MIKGKKMFIISEYPREGVRETPEPKCHHCKGCAWGRWTGTSYTCIRGECRKGQYGYKKDR